MAYFWHWLKVHSQQTPGDHMYFPGSNWVSRVDKVHALHTAISRIAFLWGFFFGVGFGGFMLASAQGPLWTLYWRERIVPIGTGNLKNAFNLYSSQFWQIWRFDPMYTIKLSCWKSHSKFLFETIYKFLKVIDLHFH